MSKNSNVLIDEVRAARHQIVAQCDNDPDKITRYAEQLAASLGFRSPVRRRPGLLRGRAHIAKDFDAPDPELENLFENSL